jgi:hypothetical protein
MRKQEPCSLPGLTAGRGARPLRRVWTDWADVDAAFDYWSQKLRYRRFEGEHLVVTLVKGFGKWRQIKLLAEFYRQLS